MSLVRAPSGGQVYLTTSGPGNYCYVYTSHVSCELQCPEKNRYAQGRRRGKCSLKEGFGRLLVVGVMLL